MSDLLSPTSVLNDVEREIDNLVTWLALAEPKRRQPKVAEMFDDVEPIFHSFGKARWDAGLGGMWEDLMHQTNGSIAHAERLREVTPKRIRDMVAQSVGADAAALLPPLDLCYAHELPSADDPTVVDPEVKFELVRVHRVRSARRIRGLIRHDNASLHQMDIGWVESGGRFKFAPSSFLGATDTKWLPACDWMVENDLADHAAQMAGRAMLLSIIRTRTWRVSLGYEGNPRVSFDTDPEGAREVFRLRDMPEGKGRRSALLHWVREHWRKRREAPDGAEASKVRAHLRGATDFTWNGLRCRVVPSFVDRELATLDGAT